MWHLSPRGGWKTILFGMIPPFSGGGNSGRLKVRCNDSSSHGKGLLCWCTSTVQCRYFVRTVAQEELAERATSKTQNTILEHLSLRIELVSGPLRYLRIPCGPPPLAGLSYLQVQRRKLGFLVPCNCTYGIMGLVEGETTNNKLINLLTKVQIGRTVSSLPLLIVPSTRASKILHSHLTHYQQFRKKKSRQFASSPTFSLSLEKENSRRRNRDSNWLSGWERYSS